MHSQNYRWTTTTTISALIAATFIAPGCRGTKPFGRFVKVTQEAQSDLPYVDPPQQRLATSQTRGASEITGGETEITMTVEPISQGPSRSENAQPNRSDLAVDRVSGDGDRSAPPSKRRTLQQDIVRRDNLSRDGDPTKRVAAKVTSQKSNAQNPTRKRSVPSPQVERLASQRKTTQRHNTETQKTDRNQPAVDAQVVDTQHSDLLDAFADYPPEVQREALRRLVAATSKSAKKTGQPSGFESELQKQANHLPELPPAKNSAAEVPATRLGAPPTPKPRRSSSVVTVADRSRPHEKEVAVDSAPQEFTGRDLLAQQQKAAQQKIAEMTNRVTNLATGVLEPAEADDSAMETIDSSLMASNTPPVATSIADVVTDVSQGSVQPVSASRPNGEMDNMVARAVPDSGSDSLKGAEVPSGADSMSGEALYQALVNQLSTAPQGENDSQRSSRLIKLRHLMVLSGDVDSAVKKIEGMSESEQEFLRHQLLGLWTMVDPSGHPVASRRITTALPQLRQATRFAAAATDSLEVRSVSFCSEIESYGQIKPFKSNRFDAGQQVILYCEIENFSAKKGDEGFVTEMQGSYDIFDANNQKVVSQLLPADRQVSSNYLRDYYIAYQMHLPKQLPAGKYRMQLTMEDVAGKKYGQSSIDLEVK